MANRAIGRNIRLWRDEHLSPIALSQVLAFAARKARDDLISSGSAPPIYRTFVDGVEDASEDQVRPTGQITYKFSAISQAVAFAIGFLIAHSPEDDGEYKDGWFVIVDGQRYLGEVPDIPSNSEVWISNPLPYARAIDTGSIRTIGIGIVESARQALLSAFPGLIAERTFINIPAGAASIGNRFGPVPYILKGHAHRPHVVKAAKLKARKAGRIFHNPRSDQRRGEVMSYPTLVIRSRR